MPFPSTQGESRGRAASSSRMLSPSTRRGRGAPSATPSHMMSPNLSARSECGVCWVVLPCASPCHSTQGEFGGPWTVMSPGLIQYNAQAAVTKASKTTTRPGSSLVLGSSMVRVKNVRVENGHMSYHSGALVLNINNSALNILLHNLAISTVVV